MSHSHDHSSSARLYDRAAKVLPGGNSRHTVFFPPHPLYAVRGQGARVWDADGVDRIDFINNWSSLFHGHNHPKIVEAIKKQADNLLSVGMPTESEIRLAEILSERLPGVEQVRFANSGTEGVLMAVKAARAYTGRRKIAKFEGCYHGSAETAAVSVSPSPDRWGDPEAPASVAPNGVGPGAADDVVILPMNNVEAARRLIEDNADELAGVLVDPFPSHLGFVPISGNVLRMLRETTEQRGLLLIFDEVYSLRLGFHGAQGALGVIPDLTALGKVIGGGLPVGAVGGKAEIMTELFDPRSAAVRLAHGGTFNANPMTMAAGIAAMELLDEECFDRVSVLGDRLREGLAEAVAASGGPGRVRGAASMTALIHTDKDVTDYREFVGLVRADPTIFQRAELFFREMLANGVFMAPQGIIVLSSAMKESDIDYFVEKAAQILKSMGREAA